MRAYKLSATCRAISSCIANRSVVVVSNVSLHKDAPSSARNSVHGHSKLVSRTLKRTLQNGLYVKLVRGGHGLDINDGILAYRAGRPHSQAAGTAYFRNHSVRNRYLEKLILRVVAERLQRQHGK
jgi:hypothetical protein